MTERAVFIAYYFPPRGGSGVQRSSKFAKYLPDFGFEPLVLTTDIDSITNTFDNGLSDELESIRVQRVPSKERFLKKLAGYGLGFASSLFLIPDPNVLWNRKATRVAIDIADKHDAKLIYVTVQPWSSSLVGLKAKRATGLPLVVDLRDPWARGSNRTWITRLHQWMDQRIERRVVEQADAIIVATPGMMEDMKSAYPAHQHKIHLVFNGFDQEDLEGYSDPIADEFNSLRIGFTGRFYRFTKKGLKRRISAALKFKFTKMDWSTHSPFYLMHAIAALLKDNPRFRGKISLHFAGQAFDEQLELANQLGIEDVLFQYGYLPHDQSIKLLRDCNVLFLPMGTEEDGRRSVYTSGKLFEYLSLKRFILAAVPQGDAADIINRSGAGCVIDPYDIDGLKNLLENILEDQNRYLNLMPDHEYIQRFERRRLAGELAGIFRSLIDKRGSTVGHAT